MDSLIKRFDSERDSDLRLCVARGVAYQKNMVIGRVAYDDAYLGKFQAYDAGIEQAVNAGRCALVARHCGHLAAGAPLLDIGAGSGAFVREALAIGFSAKGLDVIPGAVKALKDADMYAEDPHEFDVVTMWDTIEHLEHPEITLRAVRKDALLFASLPVFEDLRRVRESKHYRPGEHLYYWSVAGFVDWMALYGFRVIEESSHETEAGREQIAAFAFRRDLPDYHDHIAAYQQMHANCHYGDSASELYLDDVTQVVRALKPKSILDYGCGRSDLVAHFWRDGERRIIRYDPAIARFKDMPDGEFDLVLCMDVLEHIPMASVDRVLGELRRKGARVLFTISTKLARAKLPDGRNAHVTLLTRSEWTLWLQDVFGPIQSLPSRWEHELLLLAGAQLTTAKKVT